MLSWQWPLMFVLLPLPLLVRWLLKPYSADNDTVKVPYFALLKKLDQGHEQLGKTSFFKVLLTWLMWCLLLAAAAQPQWIGEPVSVAQDRRDLMLAVDISESMLETDMLLKDQYIDRISTVKNVVGEFVQQRTGDRLGLILFAQQAYLMTPLTHDRETVKQQLQEALVGFAGRATAIGDTIGLAIKNLRDRPTENRVLVLLTDGANSAGSAPKQAADIAAEAGIRIHTIGVGASTKLVQDFFGRTRKVNQRAQFDEDTLRYIATQTGGSYFHAEDPTMLKTIYAQLDHLEPQADEQFFRPRQSLVHWPAIAALACSLLLCLFHNGRGLRLSRIRGSAK